MRKILLSLILLFSWTVSCYAAPCYGTKMPEKKQFFIGGQTHAIFERHLEAENGEIRSTQHLFLISYGVYDWLSIDLKGGAGNVKQHPVGSDEIDYTSSFAGGYGFRIKLYDNKKIKAVFGFQHISVHPKSARSAGVKHTAILDDWQVSFLASYEFPRCTPYLGTRCDRIDYIHWEDDTSRKRTMSDRTRNVGLVVGFDVPVAEKIWLNLEGNFFDSEAFAFSVNYEF